MKEYYIMDGNEACATAAYLFTEIAGIYPITPATPMATLCDKWSAGGKLNLFNEKVKVIEMQSEGGASALVHGSLQAGSLSTTFTASQGLLLMIPTMYKVAGEMLPLVIHVAARSLATHALSIYGDHQDVYATRSTGFAFLSSSNVQEAYYMALITHLSAIKSSIPFVHFFDGFRTSHELNKISILSEESVLPLIDKEALKEFKDRAINIGKNITRGTSQTEDVYFQNTEARNKYYLELPNVVNSCMEDLNRVAGTDYKPFNYYGSPNAKHIIIAMGSVTDTIKLTIEEMMKNGEEVGLINVHLFRPFSSEYFLKSLPKTVTKITVMDRTKETGETGAPLYLDVCEVLKGENIEVYSSRYGLSSKMTTPQDIKAIYNNMDKNSPIKDSTIGIIDDVTNMSLAPAEFMLNKNFKEIKIYGFGSDGMVSASKNILKLLGKKDGTFVQGYFEYDSKKSGGVTVSHLRVHGEPINAPYYPLHQNLVVVTKESYLTKFDVLDGIREDGIFLLNSSKNEQELNEYLPNKLKSIIKNKNIKFFVSDTSKLNEKYNLNGKINNIIAVYILSMLGCKSEDIDTFKGIILKSYADKGEDVIKNNIDSLNDAFEYCKEIDNNTLTIGDDYIDKKNGVYECMTSRCANELPVSEFLKHKDGTYSGGNSKFDKRRISEMVPKWNKNNCIECNMCSFICPHSVIRPFSITEEELNKAGLQIIDTIPSVGEEGKGFYICVSESNCTGCGLCVDVCPGKGGEKALNFGKYDEEKDKVSEYLFENVTNESKFNKFTVKGVGFKPYGFEFCGACAGCGESGYLKLLTSLFKEEIVVANATGCSSIYGGSLPSLPYKVPWANSLFEDNAEFGYGLYMAYKTKRDVIKDIMYKSKDIVLPDVKDIYKNWIDNNDDYSITSKAKEDLTNAEIPSELKELLDYIPSRTTWIVGGDGWAYDIGYGGLDHVLHSNENINVLVLDTEVYSNTGGQTSKSTKFASIAEFASNGKTTNKKDLFRIAMSIPNVYVASISMGANPSQTLKAFKEAYEHKGPSIIIAYSPCIEQGITGGLRNSIREEKLLVESGYNLLMRYSPAEEKLYIDSGEPDFSKYDTIFEKELRYKNLKVVNEKEYEQLYNLNLDSAKKRYEYYKKIKGE